MRNNEDLKRRVQEFWDFMPCDSEGVPFPEGSLEFFEAVEERRYTDQDLIHAFAQFTRWSGKRVLEVGVGMGTDFLQFGRARVDAYGIDLSPRSAALTRKRLQLYGLSGHVLLADAERLPFPDDQFDLVYSFGVLHHTPDPPRAIAEIYRVLKPCGQVKAMMYHRRSALAFALYVKHALLRMKPFSTLTALLAKYVESPGTKAYTVAELKRLFATFIRLQVRPVMFPWEQRWKQQFFRRKLPLLFCLAKLYPDSWASWILIQGEKPAAPSSKRAEAGRTGEHGVSEDEATADLFARPIPGAEAHSGSKKPGVG